MQNTGTQLAAGAQRARLIIHTVCNNKAVVHWHQMECLAELKGVVLAIRLGAKASVLQTPCSVQSAASRGTWSNLRNVCIRTMSFPLT